MYRLYIDSSPTDILTESKRGAWDLIQESLWDQHYPGEDLPARWRAKFVREEELDFDSLPPMRKVQLIGEFLKEFHNQELCILCGEPTQKGNRVMIPIDGVWPDHYFNLWKHRECRNEAVGST